MKTARTEALALAGARARLALMRSVWALHLRAVGGAPPSQAPGAATPAGLQEALRRWWEGHRLKGGVDLLVPLLRYQARKHPFGLVALALLAGAVLPGLRPWRALPWLVRTVWPTLPISVLWQALQEALRAHDRDPPSAP